MTDNGVVSKEEDLILTQKCNIQLHWQFYWDWEKRWGLRQVQD